MIGRTSRRRTEQGASLVEFALLVPIMALIVFGIIEFGLAFSDQQNLRQAVREGTRLITVSPDQFVSGGAFDAARLRDVIEAEAGLTDSATRMHVNWSPTGTLHQGDDFVVCATYELESKTLLLSPFIEGKKIRSLVHMRFEDDFPVTITPSGDPDAPSCSGTAVGPTTTLPGPTTTVANPCATDTSAPTGTFSAPTFTAVTDVTLSLNFSDPSVPMQMEFSNDGSSFSGYSAYATSASWTVPGGDGDKTITAHVKDACGNTATVSDTTTLDTVAPTAPSLTIASFPCTGGNRTVSLSWTASTDSGSGWDHYQIESSDDGVVWSASGGSLATTTGSYTGQKSKAVQLRVNSFDRAGNPTSSNTVSLAANQCE